MSETTYSITDLTPTLIERLFELERRVFNRPFDLVSRSVEEFTTYNGKSTFILASDGGETLGFLGFSLETDASIELKIIAIEADKQGQGHGRKLLHTLETAHPGKKIFLTVHPNNTQGIVFYLKHGFHIRKWIENYYGDGQPRLVLEKFPNFIITTINVS